MGHGDGCFNDQFRDDFVFVPIGVVVGGLAELTGGQGDAAAVDAPGTIGVAHQGVFERRGFLQNVVPANGHRCLGDELSGPARNFLDEH